MAVVTGATNSSFLARDEMKLLCATHFYPPSVGGMQVSNSLLVDSLAGMVDEIELHVFGDTAGTAPDRSNVRTRRHAFDPRSLSDLRNCAKLILRRERELRPDHVVLLDEAMVRALGTLPLSARQGIRAPVASVNSGSTLTRLDTHLRARGNAWLVKRGYRWLNRLIVSQSTAEDLSRKYPTLNARVRVLGRPIADWFFEAPDASGEGRQLVGSDAPIFFSCARAIPEKGIGFAIDALARLRELRGSEGATFVFAGDGPFLEVWKRQAAGHALRRVHFLGNQPPQQLLTLYDASRACVFPSLSTVETFGRTWVEAFARRRPVISTVIANLKHLVRDDYNGLIVEPEADSICRAMETMLSLDPANYERLCGGAYASGQPYRQSVVARTLLEHIA